MSICVYVRIDQKYIDEDLLEKFLIGFFSIKSNIIREKSGDCVSYEGMNSENGTMIFPFLCVINCDR